MRLQTLSLLILDFDGTLVQSNEIKKTAFKRLFKDYPEHYEQLLVYGQKFHSLSRHEKFEHCAEKILGLRGAEKEALVEAWTERYRVLTRRAVIDCPFVEGA